MATTPAETRFRFSSPCLSRGCAQWESGRCGVVDRVLTTAENQPPEDSVSLPDCAIRTHCRWHIQRGDSACHVCPGVVTASHEVLEEV